jgi:L-histidine N-alpha-methyltransferase
MMRDVVRGLSLEQKELSPKYFYDTRGSELFEEITRLEEYYPTRTERALLKRVMPRWVGTHRPASLMELGAGSAKKSRIILDAMVAAGCGRTFIPLDVSEDFLQRTAASLRSEYPTLAVVPRVADMMDPLPVPEDLQRPAWLALLGSTIGNFRDEDAAALLSRIAAVMTPKDGFLLGADLRPGPRKSMARLERAYDDAAGMTAAFNLNVLEVLNRSLGSDFDASQFRHMALYNVEKGRIEMHLESLREQMVRIPGAEDVRFAEGESIRTEISCKYDPDTVTRLFAAAGLELVTWEEDEEGLFALILGRLRA